MIRGIIIFFSGIFAIAVIMTNATKWIKSDTKLPEQRFEIVDKYQGCDVVRYIPEWSGRYYFFLHCK